VHGLNPPPSSSHSKVDPGSVAVKEKLAAAEELGLIGDDVMVVFGAPVSTVQVYVAGVSSTFPATSVARTLKVWEPSAKPA
jgi:class 3 adenylate cyclase